MTDQANKILVRAVDCLEILNNRPRPMCRDCADFGPICPHTGLDCNVKNLIASARAALSASAPETMVDMVPPATSRDRWMYEQGRLAERDPRTPGSLAAQVANAPAAGSVPSDEEIQAVAESMRMQPWGIGSRQEDAIAYGRALLAQYGSPARSDADREVIEAARNLVKVKGRHHGELAYKRLADAVASAPQEGK